MGSLISRLMGDHHGDHRGEEHEGEREHIPLDLVRTCCVQLLGSDDFEKFDLEY